MNDSLSSYNLPHAPAIPFNPEVTIYRRFGPTYEPWEYTDWMDESMSWKETCYIGNWSSLTKYRFKGPDAQKFLSLVAVNSFERFHVGQGKHMVMCNENGKLTSSGVLLKLAEDDFLYMGRMHWFEYQLNKGDFNVIGNYLDMFVFHVQGPNSLYVLEKVTEESLRDINFMRFRKSKIRGKEVTILRAGMSGELGYEISGPMEYAIEIYNVILEAGQEFGIRRLGGRAKQINHVEACFPTNFFDYLLAYFNEDEKERLNSDPKVFSYHSYVDRERGTLGSGDIRDYYRSPVELGWTNRIKFDHEFIGYKALEEEIINPKRNMVTLVWNSDDVVDAYSSMFKKDGHYKYMELPRDVERSGMVVYSVMKDGKLVGVASSRCYSYYFREMISLCTLDVKLCTPGTEVTVIWGEEEKPQKPIRAIVAPAPYKKDNRRIDVTDLPSYLKK